MSTSDSLLSAVANGDVSAFEALYDRHASTIYALLLRILGNPDDAEEILQEAFVKAWSSARLFDPVRGSEVAWLISIARSRAIDRLRSRRIRSDRENDAGREHFIHAAFLGVETAMEHAIESEERIAVRAALAHLPEAQRRALELAYFEGLSQSEIAERLHEPLGTIKTRIQLGMKKLRDELRDYRPTTL